MHSSVYKNFISYFKLSLISLVFAVFSTANAGSYDDFFTAIERDNSRAITALLQRGFDPNTIDPQARHGLTMALADSALNAAEALLEAPGIDVNFLNAQDESPLMYAALNGHLALAKKLIEKDADVNKTGWTPLHYAATKGHVEVMRLLLDSSAFVDAESPNGTTPLMMAAQYGNGAAVKLLLDEGAQAMQKNQQGLTALDFAQRGSRPDAINFLSQPAVKPQQRQPAGRW
ncbi:MAG: ankyrin repeat protein [Polaromonas sp.]|jgi:ankyrin repeat protein